jgi:hypothetical protein
MSIQPQLPSESDMNSGDVTYEATPRWLADLVLKASRLMGRYPGLLDTAEQRGHATAFTSAFMLRMAMGEAATDEAHDAVYCMSQLRKAIGALIAEAATPARSTKQHLSYAALDWLQAAYGERVQPSLVLGDALELRRVCVTGGAVLRAALSDAATYYMDHTRNEMPRVMEVMLGKEMPKLVCRALSTQFLAMLFDCTRIASGARLANRAFGDELAPLTSDVRRCELARADAYMAMRLYAGLELVVAMMMMGVAKRAEREGKRDMWSLTLQGRAVLAFREDVAFTLDAYDNVKRVPALRAGKTYTAQTPGYVAALQEQAALLAAHINEDADSPLYDALVAGLSEAQLFSIPTRLSPLRGITPNSKYTFWSAVAATAELHAERYPHGNEGRVPPFESAMAMTISMAMTSALEKLEPLVQVSGSMRAAMIEASKSWPAVTKFYGRDYAETERKITAKAAREGRDPEGREVGESFGYRLEWMGYLANGAPPRPVSRGGADDQARLCAAVTTLSRVEMLHVEGSRTALPIPSGNAIHHIHGVSLACDPGLAVAGSPFYEPGDERYRALASEHRNEPLVRKQLFVERVLERTAPMFKGWSGGVLVAEPYYDFFAEVWKRFNASLRHSSSAWGGKIARWMDHYAAGTTPPRANGEAKLIHPWRAQYLQQSIARVLLDERYGEQVVQEMDPNARAAARLHRALLGRLVESYDYAPWASHLVRRFCTMEEHRVAAKRKREEDDRAILSLVSIVRRDTGATRPRSDPAVSPSLARSAGPLA